MQYTTFEYTTVFLVAACRYWSVVINVVHNLECVVEVKQHETQQTPWPSLLLNPQKHQETLGDVPVFVFSLLKLVPSVFVPCWGHLSGTRCRWSQRDWWKGSSMLTKPGRGSAVPVSRSAVHTVIVVEINSLQPWPHGGQIDVSLLTLWRKWLKAVCLTMWK